MIVPALRGQFILGPILRQREGWRGQRDDLRVPRHFVESGFDLIDDLLAREGFFNDIREPQDGCPPASLLTTFRFSQKSVRQQNFVLLVRCGAHRSACLLCRALSGNITTWFSLH